MVYGIVLAGGIGSRMGGDKPKQYLTLKGKPVIIYTIEKFFTYPDFEKVIVLCPSQWVEHTKDLIKKHIAPAQNKVCVIEGGATRNETIMNAVDYIEENIAACREYDACDTVIKATDTIVESKNEKTISAIPNRSHMYQGQTPQSFKAAKLKQLYGELSAEEKDILTDAAKIFVLKGEKVALVEGETFNIKITYPYDLRVARSLLEDEE